MGACPVGWSLSQSWEVSLLSAYWVISVCRYFVGVIIVGDLQVQVIFLSLLRG